MSPSVFMMKNQLHDITVSVERVYHANCDKNWKSDAFIPPFSSIGYILNGEGTMWVNENKLHPKSGELYLLPAGTVQSFYAKTENPYEKYYCHFEARCGGVELFELIQTPLCISGKDHAIITGIFEGMIQAKNETSITAMVNVKRYMLDLLSCFLDCCPPESIKPKENKDDLSLYQAVKFAEQNIKETTVNKMAEIAGYHPVHFTKVFKERFGVLPVKFIVRKKTEKAISQLTNTNLSVSLIAEQLGFSNQFYFSHFFKNQTGMTPTEYRSAYVHKIR